jgi:hypothetical protein
MTRPSHSYWFDHPKNIWWGVQIIKFLFMWSLSLPPFPVHKKQLENLQFCRYILIFIFLDSKLENKRICSEWQTAICDFNLLLILHEWRVIVRASLNKHYKWKSIYRPNVFSLRIKRIL